MGWRTAARAARAVLRLAGVGQEVWEMRTAASRLREEVGLLAHSSSRSIRRGKALSGNLNLVIADADQAFEACTADRVLGDWSCMAQVYQEHHFTENILARRGRKDICKPGGSAFGRGWW